MIDRWIGFLLGNWLIDSFVEGLVDWLIDSFVEGLVDWLIDSMIDEKLSSDPS